jgi:glycosyltransferase involved in cell wall biosynthesis
MACGTPVIGSAVGGIKTTVLDGETGYLVAPNDPDGLAARLADLLLDPARARAFGRRAVRHANALYTWRRVAQSIAELYDDVLDAGRADVGVVRVPRPEIGRMIARP